MPPIITLIALHTLAGCALALKLRSGYLESIKQGVMWPLVIYRHPSKYWPEITLYTFVYVLISILFTGPNTFLYEVIMLNTHDTAPMLVFIIMIAWSMFRCARHTKSLTTLLTSSAIMFYVFSGYGTKVSSMVILFGALLGLMLAGFVFLFEAIYAKTKKKRA